MPVEIREIVIKTTIISEVRTSDRNMDKEVLQAFKKSLLGECKRMIAECMVRKSYHR